MAPPKSNPSQRQRFCTAKVAQTMRYCDAAKWCGIALSLWRLMNRSQQIGPISGPSVRLESVPALDNQRRGLRAERQVKVFHHHSNPVCSIAACTIIKRLFLKLSQALTQDVGRGDEDASLRRFNCT